MPGLTPRRLTGRTLQLGARLGRLPLIGAGVRAAAVPLLGLDALRQADLGAAPPHLAPPPAADREGPTGR